ncbi:MAG: uracil-xanthine permease family protein [Ardenticatenaceae bacterium]
MAQAATADRALFTGYLPNDAPSIGPMVALALQHVLTMFPATVLVALLTNFDVGVTLFASGLATIVALFVSSRITGTYIPLYYGSSFSYIAPIVAITATNIYDIPDLATRIRIAQGGIIMTGLLNVLVGIAVRYVGKRTIDRILPAEVTGSVAIVIGIALAFVAIGMAADNWTVSLITLIVTILASVYLRGRGFIGMIPVLIGVVVGYLIALLLGLVDFTPVGQAAWLRVPAFSLPLFLPGAILAIAPIAIATIPESTAHLYQISLYVDQLAVELRRPPIQLSRFLGINLLVDGIGDMINGLLGGAAGTNYGENNSLMAITRNYSGPVLVTAGIIAILLGFVGKLAALVQTLPLAVTGGLSIYLFGVIGAQGIALQMAEKVNLFDPRKLAIIAVILVIGIGGSIGYEGGMIPLFNVRVPAIATAAVAGILLNLIFLIFPAGHIDAEFERVPVEEMELEV